MAQDIVFDYRKLRALTFEHFGSNKELAKEMGISEVSLSRKMNGKVDFSSDDIIKICRLLDIPVAKIGLYFFTEKENA